MELHKKCVKVGYTKKPKYIWKRHTILYSTEGQTVDQRGNLKLGKWYAGKKVHVAEFDGYVNYHSLFYCS